MNYRVTAKWEPTNGNRTVDVPNVLDDVTPTPVPGVAIFHLNGQEYRLTGLEEGDKQKKLFFVFSDPTKALTLPRWPLSEGRSCNRWHCRAGL
jgi:uncharacterized protein (DUF1684 family)